MNIETITFQQVIDGYVSEGDVYGLASYALAEPRKTAFLSNPFLTDTSKVMLKLLRDNGIIIGRSMMFPSRFKADDMVIETMGGSALEVAKEYRNGEAGAHLMAYNIRHKENNAIISSGFSQIAAKCHKALRAYMLCFPQLMQVINYRKVLQKAGLNKIISSLVGVFLNVLTWPIIRYVRTKSVKMNKHFSVRQETVVPDWVDEISINDGHKYMEVHDHKWLQWNLDNMFHDHPDNCNRFYSVSNNGDNIGFFMIKERHAPLNRGKGGDMVIGSICEWGTKESDVLSEEDVHVMALSHFSPNVDVIFMATNDNDVVKRMRKFLFFSKGEAKIAFYDLRKEYKEAKDINLWRVRMGYGDTILN